MMQISTLRGMIKRRILVNYRADPEAVRRLLPPGFEPKLLWGRALVGVCLIRLESMRPPGFPKALGLPSENAAHRIAATWRGPDGQPQDGVFISKRHTGSALSRWAGERLFPIHQQSARFEVRDDGTRIDFKMKTVDGDGDLQWKGVETESFPSDSVFASLSEASEFYAGGSVGISESSTPGDLHAVRLETANWGVAPMEVKGLVSAYFDDPTRFAAGEIEFDHALIMRDLSHAWRSVGGVPKASSR